MPTSSSSFHERHDPGDDAAVLRCPRSFAASIATRWRDNRRLLHPRRRDLQHPSVYSAPRCSLVVCSGRVSRLPANIRTPKNKRARKEASFLAFRILLIEDPASILDVISHLRWTCNLHSRRRMDGPRSPLSELGRTRAWVSVRWPQTATRLGCANFHCEMDLAWMEMRLAFAYFLRECQGATLGPIADRECRWRITSSSRQRARSAR